MSGITFGSVGDIIAVGQLAYALATALRDSRGSAKEYQSLIKELQSFDQALLQVIALWQNYQESDELEELGRITREAVGEWRDELLVFRSKVERKYGKSLGCGGSGNWMVDKGKKVLWMSEKDDIAELRTKLGGASDRITMLVLAAMGKSNKLDSNAQAVRVELVHCLLQESIKRAEEQMRQLKVMDGKLDEQMKKTDLVLTQIRSSTSFITQIPAIAIDMKNLLSLFRWHIISQQNTPRGLGTHWQQAPVTLEDALGFILPIPLELVNSWEMFDLILTKRFEKHPGHRKVQNREFAIEDDTTGMEVNRKSDWSMCFRPGQKVDMSVLFNEDGVEANYCPRCKTKSAAGSDERTQCINPSCRMWFQRVFEVEEPDEFENVSPGHPVSRLMTPAEQVKYTSTRNSPVINVKPGDFQRVKLLGKDLRSKNYARDLHDYMIRSGMTESEVIDTIAKAHNEIPKKPAFTVFLRRQLSIETLKAFRIDYEFDQDSDYLIVNRWVPEYEQGFLINHTANVKFLRENQLPEGLSPGFVGILNMIRDGLQDAESGGESQSVVSKEAGDSDAEAEEVEDGDVKSAREVDDREVYSVEEVDEAEDVLLGLGRVGHSEEYDEDEFAEDIDAAHADLVEGSDIEDPILDEPLSPIPEDGKSESVEELNELYRRGAYPQRKAHLGTRLDEANEESDAEGDDLERRDSNSPFEAMNSKPSPEAGPIPDQAESPSGAQKQNQEEGFGIHHISRSARREANKPDSLNPFAKRNNENSFHNTFPKKDDSEGVNLFDDSSNERLSPVPVGQAKITKEQAFSNRYDFDASLSAAIQAANSALGERSGLTMKPTAKKHTSTLQIGVDPDEVSSRLATLQRGAYPQGQEHQGTETTTPQVQVELLPNLPRRESRMETKVAYRNRPNNSSPKVTSDLPTTYPSLPDHATPQAAEQIYMPRQQSAQASRSGEQDEEFDAEEGEGVFSAALDKDIQEKLDRLQNQYHMVEEEIAEMKRLIDENVKKPFKTFQ